MLKTITSWFLTMGCMLMLCQTVHAKDRLALAVPPSIWVQQDNEKISGPLIDLLETIFSDLGVAIAPVSLPWARAIEQMKSGDLDMIPVIFQTEERRRFMAFSIPYVHVPTAIFVPKGKTFAYKQLSDLKGKKGLMMRSDSISDSFKAYEPELNLSKIASYEQMLKMLVEHRAQYAVAAQYGFSIEAKRFDCDDKIERLPVPIATRALHLAFSKKSRFRVHLPAVNQKIKDLQAEGVIDAMVTNTIRMAAGAGD